MQVDYRHNDWANELSQLEPTITTNTPTVWTEIAVAYQVTKNVQRKSGTGATTKSHRIRNAAGL